MKKIIIIGGGASGLAAAISAAWRVRDIDVTILERKERVGKKILATGNGCCNITNKDIDIKFYHSGNMRQFEKILTQYKSNQIVDFFSRLGLLCKTEENGRLYPFSYQASSVLDVLRNQIKSLNINVVENFDVLQVTRDGNCFTAKNKKGETIRGEKLIIATGGCASPQLGSDGSGFALLQSLGHTISPLKPALVQLKTDISLTKALQGIKVNADFSIWDGRKQLFSEQGEVLFTAYGLSGPPVIQGSRYTCFYENLMAQIDLMPEYSIGDLTNMLLSRRSILRHTVTEDFFTGLINKKIGHAIGKLSGIEKLSLPVSRISDTQIKRIAQKIKGIQIPIYGTKGWDSAQITAGGAILDEFDMETMESKKVKGLYVCGEVLDVFGHCGGYNLHFAWSSGLRAGDSAAAQTD